MNIHENPDLFEEMPPIDQIRVDLSCQVNCPDYGGQNAMEVLNTCRKTNLGRRPGPLGGEVSEEAYNYPDGYDGEDYMPPQQGVCDTITCNPRAEYFKTAEMLQHAIDPASDEIVQQIQILSEDNFMDKNSLATQYQTFIRVAYMDWLIFRPMLVNACKMGYNTLHVCLHSTCTVIQLQHSKAFTNNIAHLGQLIDQFKIQTNQATKQLDMDRSFQEDLTRQLNSFTTSVAGLSEKLDNKTLELSRPTAKLMTPAATPTADLFPLCHQNPLTPIL